MIARRSLIGAAPAVLLAGCAMSATEAAARLPRPADVAGLLTNMRAVTVSGAILEDAFYTEANLRRVFGAARARIERSTQYGFVGIVTGAAADEFPVWASGARLDFRAMGGLTSVTMGVDLMNSRFSFADVERVLGSDWEIVPPLLPPHPPPPRPGPMEPLPTAPHANEAIQYRLDQRQMRRSFELRFDRDGMLATVVAECGLRQA